MNCCLNLIAPTVGVDPIGYLIGRTVRKTIKCALTAERKSYSLRIESMQSNNLKLNWIPKVRTDGASASLFDSAITVEVIPAYTSGDKLYGKFEVCIGLRYWSRDKRSKGDERWYFNTVEEAKIAAERVVKAMLEKGVEIWKD